MKGRMKMKYSVLLLRPDYAANPYGTDTYLAHVEGHDAAAAVRVAQAEMVSVDDANGNPGDYHPLVTIEGWHDDLTPEVYR